MTLTIVENSVLVSKHMENRDAGCRIKQISFCMCYRRVTIFDQVSLSAVLKAKIRPPFRLAPSRRLNFFQNALYAFRYASLDSKKTYVASDCC